MRKILVIATLLIMCFPLASNSKEISDSEFVGAKSQLLYSYRTLENCGLKLNLFVEQNEHKINKEDLMSMVASRGDIELSMVTVKNCLALYTLQSMQLSTTPDAQQLLVDSCLDSEEYLNGLKIRISMWIEIIKNEEASQIYNEALSCIDMSSEAINILRTFTENM
jgi:hypothetical protein